MEDSLKRFLMEAGAPATEAAIVSDLAEHAASEAAEGMSRVCNTAPPELRAMVMLLACRIIVDSFSQFMHAASADVQRHLSDGG
jgi:hypothetical protein